jgi:hypothetical protein
MDEQPLALPSMMFGTDKEYYCPECLNGYFWDISEEPWNCKPCRHSTEITNAHHCLQCPTESRCTNCDLNYFPNFKQDGCMLPIDFCKSNPSQYSNDGEIFTCPDCMNGYFWDKKLNPTTGALIHAKCSSCGDDLSNCVSCLDEETCEVCEDGYMLQPDG